MIYIYHHLGLGDHIVCNGLVRHYYNQYNEIGLFCYHHNLASVTYMYRDLPNIKIIPANSDFEIDEIIRNNQLNAIKIGFNRMNEFYNKTTFDAAFYHIAGLPFEYRYEKFYILRDADIEDYAFKELNPNNEPYIFVHDDPNRGFSIDYSKVRNDLKIITNDFRWNIFQLMKIYENAEEIHFMESSISALINSQTMIKPELFLHKYVRGYDNFGHTQSINKINVIN